MQARKIIVALAIMHKGDWDKIYQAIFKKEYPSEEEMEELVSSYKGNYITILDEEYPERLKQGHKPPFVLFYEGDISLIKNPSKNLAIGCSRQELEHETEILDNIIDTNHDIIYVLGDTQCNATSQILCKCYGKAKTIGVLPYPLSKTRNTGLYSLILSEYPEGTQETLESHSQRYRIMANITSKTLIVSCKKQASTNILTMWSLEMGNDVMAIPTSANEDFVNNRFIAEGAMPIYDSEGLVYCFQEGY